MRALSPSYGNMKVRSEITLPVQFDLRVPLPQKKKYEYYYEKEEKEPTKANNPESYKY